MYACVYVYIYICMYACVYVYIYICMYACVYVDTYMWQKADCSRQNYTTEPKL